MFNITSAIKRAFRAFGYDISRIPNISKTDDMGLYYLLFNREAIEQRRFYNIGAGSFRHSAWTNVDHKSEWYAHAQKIDIEWDLLSLLPLPIAASSAEIVYSSHTIEHVSDKAVQNVFNEAHRVLRKGGIFRVTTPDIDLALRAYRTNNKHYFYDYGGDYIKQMRLLNYRKPINTGSIQEIFLEHFATATSPLVVEGLEKRISDEELDRVFHDLETDEALDYCIGKIPIEMNKIHPGYHMNWWNEQKAIRMLHNAGFQKCYRSAYGQSASPVLRNTLKFDSTHPEMSLYIEAIK